MNRPVRGVHQLVGGTVEPTIYGTAKPHAFDETHHDQRTVQSVWQAGSISVGHDCPFVWSYSIEEK
jgi:hypothetical protein